MRDFLEEAKKIISIPSVSVDGNEELANWLMDQQFYRTIPAPSTIQK